MANKEKKQESILIKFYILALFLCGIGLWFAVSGAPKQKISVDVELEQKIIDVLSANGVQQTDIVSQYARERETTSKVWNEFYKKIQLHGNKRSENFENALRAVARSMKLGLSKTDNVDGTVTYKFYSSNMNYSNITFINPKKTVSSSVKKTSETKSNNGNTKSKTSSGTKKNNNQTKAKK